MDFVLNTRNEIERRFQTVYLYLLAACGNCTGAVLIVLDHAEKRNIQPEFAEYRRDSVNVSLAAVKEYQVGDTREVFVTLAADDMHKTAAKDFLHTAVVVLVLLLLDRKALVRLFQRSAVLENHHARTHRL